MIGGMLFVAHALKGQLSALAEATTTTPLWIYPPLIVLATLSILLTAGLHALVAAEMTSAELQPARVRYAYAASQVARYMPGKVFGVILEAQMLAPTMNLKQVFAATLAHTMLVYTWASVLAVTILTAIAIQSVAVLSILPMVLGLLWLAQRNRWLDRLRKQFASKSEDTTCITLSPKHCRAHAFQCTALLALQWTPFFVMWILLAGPSHGVCAGLWLAAGYLLASIGGSLLVLAPSGLVVREAAFVWLGTFYGLQASDLVAWAIIARIALTLADVLAAPLLWLALRLKGQ